MIKLSTHSDIDASALAVETSAAEELINEIEADEMGGWYDLPEMKNDSEVTRIKSVAERIQDNSDYLVCIGIGGSYLGHRAVIEALQPWSETKILYAGNSLSQPALQKVLNEIGDKDFSVNVISKSGTTTEPAIAFRIFKQKLITKYGKEEAYKRIYATTDANKGALHDEAAANHYETFIIPDNVGGRYSVLTPVGLLPLAVAGVDLDKLFAGAKAEMDDVKSGKSDVFRYAAIRHIMRDRKMDTEVLTCFEPNMLYFAEWWKQLFGESEGKGNGGLFPASTIGTTDLHSLGQYLQQGRKTMFETFLTFDENPSVNGWGSLSDSSIANRTLMPFSPNLAIRRVPAISENLDGLKYLENRELTEINKKAERATITAHSEQRPVLELEAPDLSEHSLGALIYFFELSCALSGKLQGVNPFDQPGVERYKNEMFKLLGKTKSE